VTGLADHMMSGRIPMDERYGFISRIGRAAASRAEVETLLLLSNHLRFADQEGIVRGLQEVDELQKMIVSVRPKLEVDSVPATRHSPLPAVRH
jgi:hypothetical protein